MKKFTKNIENFVCGNCSRHVVGGGYTNHCPACLWSRDVDINPGDRASTCGGMMRPVAAAPRDAGYVITHRCEKCGKIRRQNSAADDDIDEIIRISADSSFVFGKK